MFYIPTGPQKFPTPGGATSAAQKIPLATAPVTMPEPETYAEYLWRERTESGGEVDKTTILSEGSDISASTTSDTLPESECNHRTAGLLPEPDGTLEIIKFDFCPKCGAEL